MKNIIFTVDVEGHVGTDPINRLIYGKLQDGSSCGIDKIMDLLEVHHIKGLFFVDIAEAWHFGKDKIAEVLLHIKDRGHDVGVHIHPDHMADKDKLFLSEYSYEQQYEIIKRCTDFYEEILGERPKAFRAGKYGANKETLEILNILGYKADFSEFFGQKWCHIAPPVTLIHVNRCSNGLLEVPVTAYKSFDQRFYSRYDKLDAGMPFFEFKKIYSQISNNYTYDMIVLFAHSFSFLKWRRTPNTPTYSHDLYRRLEKQIVYVADKKKDKFVDLDELLNIYEDFEGFDDENVIETLKGIHSFLSLVDKAKKVMQAKIDIKLRKY